MTITFKSASDAAPSTVDEIEARSAAAEVSEDALWRRAAWGLAWGFVIAGLLAYGLMELTQGEETVAAKVGLSLYVAFWSGPFIGLSGAVGFHELKKSQVHRPATTSTHDRVTSGRGGPAAFVGQ